LAIVVRAVVGVLPFVHGLVHPLHLAPGADDPHCPFTPRQPWPAPQPSPGPRALTLMVATVAALALLGLACGGP